MNRGEYLEKKFGDRKRVADMLVSLQEHAATAGVTMNLEGQTHQPNTLDAHRLIHWAGLEQKQTPMVSAIFKAHWVDARRIDDHDVLVELAEALDMDGAVTRRLLAGDADKDLIMERYQHSGKMGVNSVPTFIIANQHAVPGAQPVELWDRVIADIREQLADA
jgi:predicted DsbA family dithiol-disulfide isomerase